MQKMRGKERYKIMIRQSTKKVEDIFKINISNKGLIFIIYLTNQKEQDRKFMFLKKSAKNLNRHFPTENILAPSKHKKRCQVSSSYA